MTSGTTDHDGGAGAPEGGAEPGAAPAPGGRVRVRVAALVFAGDRVLVVEHTVGDDRWKCFPGGGLEFGESPEECVRRELDEELGMACEVGPLVAVGYHIDEGSHGVELYFRCVAASAEAPRPTGGSVTGAWFVDRRRLVEMNVFPLELAAELAASPPESLSGVRYHGRFR